jgi:hypothetical protein
LIGGLPTKQVKSNKEEDGVLLTRAILFLMGEKQATGLD